MPQELKHNLDHFASHAGDVYRDLQELTYGVAIVTLVWSARRCRPRSKERLAMLDGIDALRKHVGCALFRCTCDSGSGGWK